MGLRLDTWARGAGQHSQARGSGFQGGNQQQTMPDEEYGEDYSVVLREGRKSRGARVENKIEKERSDGDLSAVMIGGAEKGYGDGIRLSRGLGMLGGICISGCNRRVGEADNYE